MSISTPPNGMVSNTELILRKILGEDVTPLPPNSRVEFYLTQVEEYIERLATGATRPIGETTTALTDGATTNPIVIDGNDYTAQINDIVFYGNKEFLFTANGWREVGDLTNLNADMIDDTNTTNKFASQAQLDQIGTNKTNILITDITSNFVAVTGYTITNVSKVYRQGNHVFGHLWVNKNSGNFDNLTIEHCVTNSIDKCAYSYPEEGFFATSNWKIENLGYVFITEDTKINVRPTATNCNYAFIKIDYYCS